MGNVLFSRNMYDSAATFYKMFLENAINNDYKGITNLKLGLCYELNGDRNEAIKFYEKASDGNSDIEEDLYAERKMDEYLEIKINHQNIKLIHYSNLIKQSRYGLAKDSLLNFVKHKDLTKEQMAEAYMYLSEISYYQKRHKESLDFAVTALKIEIENEKWIHAYAHYYAAWASFYLKNYIDAQLFLLQIEEMEEFDFSNSMLNKVYSLKRLLPSETKK
jgi:tetratricopeptide (TPR) repeat protein